MTGITNPILIATVSSFVVDVYSTFILLQVLSPDTDRELLFEIRQLPADTLQSTLGIQNNFRTKRESAFYFIRFPFIFETILQKFSVLRSDFIRIQ